MNKKIAVSALSVMLSAGMVSGGSFNAFAEGPETPNISENTSGNISENTSGNLSSYPSGNISGNTETYGNSQNQTQNDYESAQNSVAQAQQSLQNASQNSSQNTASFDTQKASLGDLKNMFSNVDTGNLPKTNTESTIGDVSVNSFLSEMQKNIDSGSQVSFSQCYNKLSQAGIPTSNMISQDSLVSQGQADFGAVNLQYANVSKKLTGTFSKKRSQAGKSLNPTALFNSKYGNIAKKTKNQKDFTLPKGMTISKIVKANDKSISKTYGAALKTKGFKTVKNNISVSSIFKDAKLSGDSGSKAVNGFNKLTEDKGITGKADKNKVAAEQSKIEKSNETKYNLDKATHNKSYAKKAHDDSIRGSISNKVNGAKKKVTSFFTGKK